MKKISEELRINRRAKGLSLDDVVGKIKIRRKYLESIEKGDFHALPSKSYAQGFVKNYANFLGIEEDKAIPLFRREYELIQQEEYMPKYREKQDKIGKKRYITPKILTFVGLSVIVVAFLGYQFSSFFIGPRLNVSQPQNGSNIEGNIITVIGKTDPQATVTVNGEDTYVGLDGKFEKSIFLFRGSQELEIVAKNRFDNKTVEVRNVKVEGE